MKIWSKMFLVAATGMMMFSSCLETIEPEGLNDLRGAKADLLRAETALVEAKAARENAEAALALAEAKVQEAIAKQEEAKVAIIEAQALLAQYEAEMQALKNANYEATQAIELEKKIAEAKADIAEAEARAAKAAAELEEELLNIQADVLNAQAAYEQAMKNLAAAKVTLTPAQLDYLAPYRMAYYDALSEVEDLTAALEAAAEDLADAMATVDEQKADKFALRLAKKQVAAAEANLEGAKEAAEIAAAALELDPKVTDWVAEKAELEAKLDAMEKEIAEGQLVHEQDAEAYREAMDELTEAIDEYEAATGYSFNEATGAFSVYATGSKTAIVGPEIYVPAPKNEEGYPMFGYSDLYNSAPIFEYGNADAYGVISEFENQIAYYSGINNEYYEAQIAGYEANIKAIEANYEETVAQYEAAVAAYKAGDVLPYYQEYVDSDFDLETPVAEYNTALKAFVTALDAYNTALKKYAAADNTEAETAITKEKDDAIATAYATYVLARQTALDTYNTEVVKYQKAALAYDRAGRSYTAILEAAAENVGAIDAPYTISTDYANVATALTDAIEAYNTAKADAAGDATFDADGKYAAAVAIYTAELKKVNDAQKAYNDTDVTNVTDAQSVYDAAYEAYTKAQTAYNKALADAGETYSKAESEANQVYNDKMADLNVAASDLFDTEYANYLYNQYESAKGNLSDAIDDLQYICDTENIEVVMGDEDYTIYTAYWPSVLVDEETQALKEIKVADIVDKEYFLATTVKNLADNLAVNKVIYVQDYYYNAETNESNDIFFVIIGAPADYPLSLPTYESFTKALEPFDGADQYEQREAYAREAYRVFANECIASGGNAGEVSWIWDGYTLLEDIFTYTNNISVAEESIANIAVAAAHVEVLEAAKAEFEAFVAETEAEIDAIREKVEAEWPELEAALEEMELAQEAYEAEVEAIEDMVDHIGMLIELYLEDTDYDGDFEAFVAALEEAYENALEDVDQAEFDLEIAKDLLARAESGDVKAVEEAQKAYDKVAKQLEEALAELAEAAEELEKAMAAIGEGTVEEDTPATEETPAE